MKRTATLLVTLVAAAAGRVQAVEQPVPGRTLTLRVLSSGAQRMLFVVRSTAIVAPSPGGPDDPTVVGATVALRAASGESAALDLPASGWSLNAAGTAYRYRNPAAPGGPSAVKVALVKDHATLRVSALSTGITLDEPSQGSVAVLFTTGTTRWCARFGGTVGRDRPGLFAARNAPAPPSCSGATTTTTTAPPTSTTTTTTTTTSTIPALCGNATIDPGEQCDPPGSACGADLCGADCTCPCDFLDPSVCLHPFPNDYFTVADPTTDTGRRVHLALAGMPRNASQKPIDPTDYNRNDGFSPGASMVLRVPGVDLGVTGAAPITDIERSLDADAPIVLVNATTLAHHLLWAEIDSNASSEASRAVIIRPAVNLAESTRYIVALRRMKDASGAPISPNPTFVAYRDGTLTADAAVEARRAHMEDLFATLAAAGVGRSDLYLAWDFTVASRRNISERLLFVRDDGFARLGAAAPTFVVSQIDDGGGAGVDDKIFRRVTGTFLVERYVSSPSPGARYVLGPDGLPLHQPTPQQASFTCNIPRAALASAVATANPGRASLYGHGLFGSNTEVNAGNVESMGNEHDFVLCATDWIGMATEDVPNAATILVDLSNFPTLTDRLQQSMLNQLFLARLMIHPAGFVSNPAFQDAFGNPVIDTSHVFYDGNSQGGIAGGTLMAVAQDITRGVLGVPAMNYSTLLTRSVDFATYSMVLYPAYPNELERPLLFALIQMLWDRSDPNGYAHHITSDPLPNTPAHKILVHEAFGDHQVANVATEVEARTLGLSIYQPALAPGRHTDVHPYFGIPPIPSFPFDGSAMVVWDSGVPPPPTTNTPPTAGSDPHGKPRSQASARQQKSEFLKPDGAVVDVCGGSPCLAP